MQSNYDVIWRANTKPTAAALLRDHPYITSAKVPGVDGRGKVIFDDVQYYSY